MTVDEIANRPRFADLEESASNCRKVLIKTRNLSLSTSTKVSGGFTPRATELGILGALMTGRWMLLGIFGFKIG